MSLKLYTAKEHAATKILIAAEFCGTKLTLPPFQLGTDNKTDAFLNMNPFGKVPVLETPEGFVFESTAIAKHVCRLAPKAGLLGRNDLDASQIDQWCDFTSNEIEPSMLTWVGPVLGHIAFNFELTKQAQTNILDAMKAMNKYFERNTFLVGERLSLADITLAAAFVPLYQRVIEPRHRTPVPNFNRWFETVTQQPAFKAVISLSEKAWCTVAQKPTKFEQKPAKDEKKKEEKKEKEPKAPKEKKEKPKKEEEDDNEPEDDVPPETKAPNPMDLLPKSTFVLDAFKREYSNAKIDVSVKYLFDNFDADGFSMWECTYKFNSECTVGFRSTNLIGGFFQRMERMHKYAFGQMLICGVETQHEITGFWIIRGQEIPALMTDVPDVELYEWVKLDPATVDQKMVQTILNWDADRNGKPCIDGKTFK